MDDVIYLTEDFEPVDKDDPKMFMVKVRMPDGQIVFGFPAEEGEAEAEAPVQNKLFVQGGPGSGHFDHEGRPGQVGGSGKGDWKEGKNSIPYERGEDFLSEHEDERDFWEQRVKRMPVRKVDIEGLNATESLVYPEKIEGMIKKGKIKSKDNILIIEYEGERYILDGHHRVIAAKERGESQVNAQFLIVK